MGILHLFWGGTLGYFWLCCKKSLLAGAEPGGVEPRLAACKENILFTVQSLSHPESIFVRPEDSNARPVGNNQFPPGSNDKLLQDPPNPTQILLAGGAELLCDWWPGMWAWHSAEILQRGWWKSSAGGGLPFWLGAKSRTSQTGLEDGGPSGCSGT